MQKILYLCLMIRCYRTGFDNLMCDVGRNSPLQKLVGVGLESKVVLFDNALF